MFTNLGDFSDLETVLNFNPPSKPLINRDGLLKIFGKLPVFPSNFEVKRGETIVHDGVNIEEIILAFRKRYPDKNAVLSGDADNPAMQELIRQYKELKTKEDGADS